jgi:hypothetical protein
MSSSRIGALGISHKVEPSDHCGIFGRKSSELQALAIKSSNE